MASMSIFSGMRDNSDMYFEDGNSFGENYSKNYFLDLSQGHSFDHGSINNIQSSLPQIESYVGADVISEQKESYNQENNEQNNLGDITPIQKLSPITEKRKDSQTSSSIINEIFNRENESTRGLGFVKYV